MSSLIYWEGAATLAKVTAAFVNASGAATDPSSVTLLVTDPAGTQTTYTYGVGSVITKTSTGDFLGSVPSPLDGLWSYVWIGTGNGVSSVQPGTWTVRSVSLSQAYCSAEELKSRLKLTSDEDDFEVNLAVAGATKAVNQHCGRFFWPDVGTVRTYSPEPCNIYTLVTDDLVSVSALATDQDGDGVYETAWQTTDYQLEIADHEYNTTATGEARPYTLIRALGMIGGKWFPYVWPWTHQDRVKVTGTWGWPAVPELVKQASLMLAADIFKTKDAPFGVQGFAEYGAVRVTPGTQAYGFLANYVRGKTKVGV